MRKTYEHWTQDQINFIVSKRAGGMKTRDICEYFNGRFNQKRTPSHISLKLTQIKKNGMPSIPEEKRIEVTYAVPKTIEQALNQLNIGLRLMENAKSFLNKMKEQEQSMYDATIRMKKIEGLLKPEQATVN